jgi:acetyl-CoA carboxylase biotin carboxyl carrier protein
MKPEDTQELKELIEFLKENNIGDFELEMARLLAAQQHAPFPAVLPEVFAASAQAHAPVAGAPAASGGEAAEDASLHVVKSPIVGTFYESPSPGSPSFVKIGDQVENGQILCIIEAMKLMNEIECDIAGEIVKRFAQSGQPVEYGQALFAVRPR